MASISTPTVSFRSRVSPLLTLISACGVAVLGVIILRQFEAMLADYDVTLSPVAVFIFDHYLWFPALALPAIVCCLLALAARNSATRIGLTIVGALLLIAPMAVLIIAAIQALTPLYTYAE